MRSALCRGQSFSYTTPRIFLSTLYPPHPGSYALSDRARYAGPAGAWHEAKKQEKRYLLFFILKNVARPEKRYIIVWSIKKERGRL